MNLEELLNHLREYDKPVAINWDYIAHPFAAWYHTNAHLFGNGYMPITRDYAPPLYMVMEDAAVKWGHIQGFNVCNDIHKNQIIFIPKKRII